MITLIFWLMGALAGSFVLLFALFADEDLSEYWMLFTIFWPLGLLVLAAMAVKKTYLVLKKILS